MNTNISENEQAVQGDKNMLGKNVRLLDRSGRTAFEGIVVRHEDGLRGTDLTIRNLQPAAILWFQKIHPTQANPNPQWCCMSRGWMKNKDLALEVAQ
jgi:hypothetical protein